MDSVVHGLPIKCKALSSNPNATKTKKEGMKRFLSGS
jgi:hypothetical protein